MNYCDSYLLNVYTQGILTEPSTLRLLGTAIKKPQPKMAGAKN